MTVKAALEYKNKRSSQRAIQIEPWAEEIVLQPESTLKLNVECTRPGPFAVLEYDETTSIWVWSPCTVRVFVDGVERTTPFMGEPFPPIP